jgi:hypothetical protein
MRTLTVAGLRWFRSPPAKVDMRPYVVRIYGGFPIVGCGYAPALPERLLLEFSAPVGSGGDFGPERRLNSDPRDQPAIKIGIEMEVPSELPQPTVSAQRAENVMQTMLSV